MSIGLEVTGSLQGFTNAMSGYVENYPWAISNAMKTVLNECLKQQCSCAGRTGFLKSTLGFRQDNNFQVTFSRQLPMLRSLSLVPGICLLGCS